MSQAHSTPAEHAPQPAVRLLYIGFDGEQVVDSTATRKQMDAVKALECPLRSPSGQAASWDDLDNPDEPRTLFQCILADRRIRVDQHTAMADRPPIAVVTAAGDRVIRLEFYEGHDALECTFDLRAPELMGKALPRWMERDPHAYDPIAFLQESFPDLLDALAGSGPAKTILDAAHPEGEEAR